jgi:phage shock protein A
VRCIDRLTLLLKADAHGVLEQLEERTLLAKQHLREAEFELDRKRAQMHACAEEARRLGEEADQLEREIASLDADVELALAGGKEELARFSVRKLLPLRRAAESARRRTAELEQGRARLADTLAVQERQLEELSAQVRTRIAAVRYAEGDAFARPAPAADEEVEIELLRRRATQASGSPQGREAASAPQVSRSEPKASEGHRAGEAERSASPRETEASEVHEGGL